MVYNIQAKQTQIHKAREALSGELGFTADQKAALDRLEELHLKHYELEAEYRKEFCALRLKYLKRFKPIYEDRAKVLHPTTKSVAEDPAQDNLNQDYSPNFPVPEFWLGAIRSHKTFCHSVEVHDWAALKYLVDITSEYLDEEKQDCFKITMKFAENPFFTNTELSKTFIMHEDPDTGESMLVESIGTVIDWKPGKDITARVITKRQRNKKTGEIRTITIKKNRASFFHFFDSHEFPSDAKLQVMDEKEIQDLENHFSVEYELGQILKDRIIPHALGWYLDVEFDSDETEDEACAEDDDVHSESADDISDESNEDQSSEE